MDPQPSKDKDVMCYLCLEGTGTISLDMVECRMITYEMRTTRCITLILKTYDVPCSLQLRKKDDMYEIWHILDTVDFFNVIIPRE